MKRLKVTSAPVHRHGDAVSAVAWVVPAPGPSVGGGGAAASSPSLLACSDDGTWSQYAHDGEFVGSVMKGADYGVCDLAANPVSPELLAAACADGTLRLLVASRSAGGVGSKIASSAGVGAATNGQALLSLREERKVVASSGGEGVGACICVRWAPDGATLATGGEDGCVKVWSRAGMLRTTLVTAGRPIYSVAWSADGGSLLYTCGKELVIASLSDSGPGAATVAGGAVGEWHPPF